MGRALLIRRTEDQTVNRSGASNIQDDCDLSSGEWALYEVRMRGLAERGGLNLAVKG